MIKVRLFAAALIVFLCYSCEDPPVVVEDRAPTVSTADAILDIDEFKALLDDHAAYAQLTTYDYGAAFTALKTKYTTDDKPVRISTLAKDLGEILAEIGDRHSYVRYSDLDDIDFELVEKRFPVTLAVLHDKIVALEKVEGEDKDGIYTKLDPIYFTLKEIDGEPAMDYINRYSFRPKKAPIASKLARNVYDVRRIGERLYSEEEFTTEEIKITYTGGGEDKEVVYPLTDDVKTYYSKVKEEQRDLRDAIEDEGDFSGILKLLGDDDVAYIRLPKMYDYDDIDGLEAFITEMLAIDVKDTRAMIIDLRYNTGGTRDLVASFAPYLIQTEESPWVANVAYLRSDATATIPIGSMTSRLLHPKNSELFSEEDKEAIEAFEEDFVPVRPVPEGKFRGPYYTVFNANRTPYEGDVYILVNEQSFSAASVFAGAFADLKNVTIAGITTDGSSGNSHKWELTNSELDVKLSRMASYQRNGKTFDTNGTVPTLEYKPDMKYLLGDFDTQMIKLSGYIGIPL